MRIRDDWPIQCPNQEPGDEGEMNVNLIVPDGAGPGQKLGYVAPDGRDLRLTIPEGVGPGCPLTLRKDPFTGDWDCIADIYSLEEAHSGMSSPRSASPDDVVLTYAAPVSAHQPLQVLPQEVPVGAHQPLQVTYRAPTVVVKHPPVFVSGPPTYTVSQTPARSLSYVPPPMSPVGIVLRPSYTPPPQPQLLRQRIPPANPMQQQAGSYTPPPVAQVLVERHSFVPTTCAVPSPSASLITSPGPPISIASPGPSISTKPPQTLQQPPIQAAAVAAAAA
eukprot:CAMPEP_0172749140 /NCGR_PEP_ID=MMETSP1074-20121228/146629_1 /TAXON_ID=2916 /ORGANISM="Ceratium fusus, Strain PA161109" /LENGTH=276 /DNA_ID=CAMNT_0013581029 /DNA_START=38 /DNA_END=864 /DNA_ORIENTATION=-